MLLWVTTWRLRLNSVHIMFFFRFSTSFYSAYFFASFWCSLWESGSYLSSAMVILRLILGCGLCDCFFRTTWIYDDAAALSIISYSVGIMLFKVVKHGGIISFCRFGDAGFFFCIYCYSLYRSLIAILLYICSILRSMDEILTSCF